MPLEGKVTMATHLSLVSVLAWHVITGQPPPHRLSPTTKIPVCLAYPVPSFSNIPMFSRPCSMCLWRDGIARTNLAGCEPRLFRPAAKQSTRKKNFNLRNIYRIAGTFRGYYFCSFRRSGWNCEMFKLTNPLIRLKADPRKIKRENIKIPYLRKLLPSKISCYIQTAK